MAKDGFNEKKRIYMLNFLKLFAILLVFNSHCDSLYPIDFLATGGALGNALFFIISGYLLKMEENFLPWILKKIKRLYIPTLIVTIITCVLQMSFPKTIIELINTFIWPTNYWFIGALVIFYILIYLLNKANALKKFSILSIGLGLIYILYYILFMDKSVWSVEYVGLTSIQGLFKLIYYFYIFVLGYYIKNNNYKDIGKEKLFTLIVITFISYFAFKFLLQKGIVSMSLQFITQIIGIAFSYICLKFALEFEEKYNKVINEKIKTTITYLSGASLEIYLLQFIVIKYCEKILFPINIIIALLITMISAIIINKVVYKIVNINIIKNLENQ